MNMGSGTGMGKIFLQEGNSGVFQEVAIRIFSKGGNSNEFSLCQLETNRKTFFF